jgi:hypothetical protein
MAAGSEALATEKQAPMVLSMFGWVWVFGVKYALGQRECVSVLPSNAPSAVGRSPSEARGARARKQRAWMFFIPPRVESKKQKTKSHRSAREPDHTSSFIHFLFSSHDTH